MVECGGPAREFDEFMRQCGKDNFGTIVAERVVDDLSPFDIEYGFVDVNESEERPYESITTNGLLKKLRFLVSENSLLLLGQKGKEIARNYFEESNQGLESSSRDLPKEMRTYDLIQEELTRREEGYKVGKTSYKDMMHKTE